MYDETGSEWPCVFTVIFVAGLLATFLIFLVKGIYDRYFHPLQDFPGPFWGSVTDLSKLSALSTSDITAVSLELHRKYGGNSPRNQTSRLWAHCDRLTG